MGRAGYVAMSTDASPRGVASKLDVKFNDDGCDDEDFASCAPFDEDEIIGQSEGDPSKRVEAMQFNPAYYDLISSLSFSNNKNNVVDCQEEIVLPLSHEQQPETTPAKVVSTHDDSAEEGVHTPVSAPGSLSKHLIDTPHTKNSKPPKSHRRDILRGLLFRRDPAAATASSSVGTSEETATAAESKSAMTSTSSLALSASHDGLASSGDLSSTKDSSPAGAPLVVVPDHIQVAIRIKPMPQTPKGKKNAVVASRAWKVHPAHSNGPAGSTENPSMIFEEVTSVPSLPFVGGPTTSKKSGTSFVFDKVFDEDASTAQVYDALARPVIRAVLEGRNATVCAYGATKSGKTFTMQGRGSSDIAGAEVVQQGVIQRAAADLFEHIQKDVRRNYKVTAQYFEVYNEQLRDLLAEAGGGSRGMENRQYPEGGLVISTNDDEEDNEDNEDDNDSDDDTVSLVPPAPSARGKNLSPRKLLHSFAATTKPTVHVSRPPLPSVAAKPKAPSAMPVLHLREVNGVLTVPAVEEEVCSVEDVIQLLDHGAKNRAVAKVQSGPLLRQPHHLSSRSHAIFRITVESRGTRSDKGSNATQWKSVLNLVDLAGSENTERSGTSGLRLREGGTINQSLLSLSRVIHSLSLPESKRPPHINYRDSKLTRILQPHLSGNACVAILCCVSPSKASVEETRSTLKFAASARKVETAPCVNSSVDHATLILNLETELSETKKALKTLQCYVDTSQNHRRKVGETSLASGGVSVYTEDDWDPFTLGENDNVDSDANDGDGRPLRRTLDTDFSGRDDGWFLGDGGKSCTSLLHPIQEVVVLSTSMEAANESSPLDDKGSPAVPTEDRDRDGSILSAEASLVLIQRLEASVRDADLRTAFLEEKLSATDKLVETLFRDLEEARHSNSDLRNQLDFWAKQDPPVFVSDEDDDEDMANAKPVVNQETVRLIKTAFYSATAFYATGQHELFLASVMFMWLSLEGCT